MKSITIFISIISVFILSFSFFTHLGVFLFLLVYLSVLNGMCWLFVFHKSKPVDYHSNKYKNDNKLYCEHHLL